MAAELEYAVVPTTALDAGDAARVIALFESNYADADVDYLRESMTRLRTIALARTGATVVGFSLGERRVVDLPRLPRSRVGLAGLACVDPAWRRRHLFHALAGLATGGPAGDERVLFCGRMAHPASFRGMARLPSVVPRTGVRPTRWQQDVGRAIAAEYGVAAFDPETFVCRGRGRPIGHPAIDIDATPEEWAAFAAVDRGRGDSLLGIAWFGDVPEGWIAG